MYYILMVQTTPQNTSIFPWNGSQLFRHVKFPVDVLAIAIAITSTPAKLMQQELQLPRKKHRAEMGPKSGLLNDEKKIGG